MASSADVVVGGGSGGGGKSFVALLETLRHKDKPLFRPVYFRRTAADLKKPKGLWDTSKSIFPYVGGRSREDELVWTFPSGCWLKMNHLEHESDIYDHQGGEYTLIDFDEATHFTSKQYWYLSSRNRAPLAAGVRAYQRLQCNPDPDSFVFQEFLDPAGYIDPEGYPIPEMSGVLRYFARDTKTEKLVWADSPEALATAHPELIETLRRAVAKHQRVTIDEIPVRTVCKSFTFIPFGIDDNPSADPEYIVQLMALPRIDRMRLLYGNWRVREAAGLMFREEFFPVLSEAPGHVRRVRFWDLAASKKKRSDHTAGVLMSVNEMGLYCVEDVVELHLRPHGTEEAIRRIAEVDGVGTEVWLEQEAGAGAEFMIDHMQRHVLQGFAVYGLTVRGLGTKVERAKPVSSAAEKQHIRIVRGTWNRPWLSQHQAFPDVTRDDQVDATSGAFHALQSSTFAVATASW